MTNGLSGPHVPLPIPCYHGDTSQLKPRDQEISIKDSLVDTGVGGINRHQQDPLVCRGKGSEMGDRELSNTGGLCPWDLEALFSPVGVVLF